MNLLKQTYPLIKSIDPTAQVMLGSIATNDANWLQSVYENGGQNYFDILGSHPYTAQYLPNVVQSWDSTPGWNTTNWTYTPFDFPILEKMWEVMDHFGDGNKPIWITEFGYDFDQPVSNLEPTLSSNQVEQLYAEGINMAWNFINDKNINWTWASQLDVMAGITSIPNVQKLFVYCYKDGPGANENYGFYYPNGTKNTFAYSAFQLLAETNNNNSTSQ